MRRKQINLVESLSVFFRKPCNNGAGEKPDLTLEKYLVPRGLIALVGIPREKLEVSNLEV